MHCSIFYQCCTYSLAASLCWQNGNRINVVLAAAWLHHLIGTHESFAGGGSRRRPSAERSRHRSALLVLPQPDYDEETSGTIRRQLQQAGDVLSSVASLRTASMPHISRQLLAPPVPDPRELPRRNHINWTDHSLDARVLSKQPCPHALHQDRV